MILFSTLATTSGNPKLDLTFHIEWKSFWTSVKCQSKKSGISTKMVSRWFYFRLFWHPSMQFAHRTNLLTRMCDLASFLAFWMSIHFLNGSGLWFCLPFFLMSNFFVLWWPAFLCSDFLSSIFIPLLWWPAFLTSRAAEAAKCGRSCWLTRLCLLNFQLSKPIPQILNSPAKS